MHSNDLLVEKVCLYVNDHDSEITITIIIIITINSTLYSIINIYYYLNYVIF